VAAKAAMPKEKIRRWVIEDTRTSWPQAHGYPLRLSRKNSQGLIDEFSFRLSERVRSGNRLEVPRRDGRVARFGKKRSAAARNYCRARR
jgi:hypothetical protein